MLNNNQPGSPPAVSEQTRDKSMSSIWKKKTFMYIPLDQEHSNIHYRLGLEQLDSVSEYLWQCKFILC